MEAFDNQLYEYLKRLDEDDDANANEMAEQKYIDERIDQIRDERSNNE